MTIQYRYSIFLLVIFTLTLSLIKYSYSEQTTSAEILKHAFSVCTKRAKDSPSRDEVLDVVDDLTKFKGQANDDTDVAFILGICYGHISDYENAIVEFSNILQSNPQYPNVRFARANSYFEAGKYAEAISDLSAVLSENQNDSFVLEKRGDAYLKMGNLDEAISDYRQALDLVKDRLVQPNSGGCSPSDESCYSLNEVNIYLKLKKVFIGMGSKDDAIRVLKEGIETNPGSRELKDELRSLNK